MKVTIKRKIDIYPSNDFCTGFDWIENRCDNIWGIFALKNCKAFKNRAGDDITIRWAKDSHRYLKCKECKDAYAAAVAWKNRVESKFKYRIHQSYGASEWFNVTFPFDTSDWSDEEISDKLYDYDNTCVKDTQHFRSIEWKRR